ncbi:unnamed protein product [Cylindrotheca closterium]|uniref:Uncharacterized protein n=1 Tax=Cylindrotheca closterium TaxID=2856 RepID=A0AAD2FVY7_9STRA|nr:unnamed protein product [Cylindrotheca closterium]
MPFFRKASRASAEKAAGAKTKNQKDSKKKKGGLFLRKKKPPLINYEDASRASSTQPQPRWNKIEIETDFTGMQPSTTGTAKTTLTGTNDKKKTLGIIVDGQIKHKKQDKNWDAFEKNAQLVIHGDEENIAFSTMEAIQEGEELSSAQQNRMTVEPDNEPMGPIDTDEYVERIMTVQTFFSDQEYKHASRSSKDVDSDGVDESSGDDFTYELTYSQSTSSEVVDESQSTSSEVVGELVQQTAKDKAKKDDKPEFLQEEEEVNEDPNEGVEELDDSDPSMSAYVSLQRIQKSDITCESTASSLKPSRSDEDSQRSEWKPKPDMTNPLGATPQEIDALNRFLSVVGPDFTGRNLSFGERKEIYDGARKVGLNKVLVDRFLDQSAGIATVEEASTYSDISPCSTYSSTSRSLMMAKSEFSDNTSATGYSRDSGHSGDSIRYNSLPRLTTESPHANQTYGCKGVFGDFFWNDSKKAWDDSKKAKAIFKAGQGLLESIGAVVVGEDGSVHGEA